MIDPSISLGVRPIQLNDPLETVGKAISLRNALARGKSEEQNQQINAEQLKHLRTANQQTDRSIADEQNLQGIWTEAGGDLAKTRQLSAERGINPKIVMELDKNIAEHATRQAQQDEAKFKAAKEKSGMLYDAAAAVAAVPEEQQEAVWNARTQQLLDAGAIDKTHVQPYPGPQGVRMALAAATTDKQIKDAATEQRAVAAAKTQALKDDADLTLKNLEITGQKPVQPDDNMRQNEQSQTSDYKNYLKDKAEGFTGNFDAWQNRDANRRRTLVQNFAPGLGAGRDTKVSGDEFLKTLPGGTAAQIKAIAEGKDGMPSASSRSQAAQSIRDAVYQYDPTFTEERARIRRAFTTGPDAKNIGNISTAIVHLGRLRDTADALNNGTFTPANELFNYVKDKFGSAATTNFGLLKDAVAGELAAALKGNATDIEIEKMGKSIRAANSPKQMKGVVQEAMGILSDKARTYDERFHRESPDDPWSPILPSAKAALDKNAAGNKPTSRIKILKVEDAR